MEYSISNICDNSIGASSLASDELRVLRKSQVSHHESDDDVATARSDAALIGLEMERTICNFDATGLSISEEPRENGFRFMESDPLGLRQPSHLRVRPEPVSIEAFNAAIWRGMYADPMADSITLSEEEDNDPSFPIERIFDLPETHQVWVRDDTNAWQQRTDLFIREGVILSSSNELSAATVFSS